MLSRFGIYILTAVCIFLQESISDFYWHYSGKEVVDAQVIIQVHLEISFRNWTDFD